MTNYLHRCMIVLEGWDETVRDLCAGMAPGGSGSNMFLVPLSVSGSLPATAWISAGAQGDDFCTIMPLTTFDSEGAPTTRPGQSAAIVYLAGKAGFPMTLAQVNAVLSAVEVTEEAWPDALARRGLKTIKGSLP